MGHLLACGGEAVAGRLRAVLEAAPPKLWCGRPHVRATGARWPVADLAARGHHQAPCC
jgi:hypothetical protein